MNYTHIHLLLNHIPTIGILIGSLILLCGFWKKDPGIQKVSLVTIVISALIAIPVFLTGDPAKESVEHISGISKSIIESHEESAEITLWIMICAGSLALLSLMLIKVKNNKMSQTIVMLTLVCGFVASLLIARTAYMGGKIRHSEVSGNTSVSRESLSRNTDDE